MTYSFDGSANTSSVSANFCSNLMTPPYTGGGAFPGPPGGFAAECIGATPVTGSATLSGTAPTASSIPETITVSPAQFSALQTLVGGLYQPVYLTRVWSSGGLDILTVQPFTLGQLIVANNDTISIPSTGGTLSVLANDTVGGGAATSANAIVFVNNPGGLSGLTVNGSMQIVVPANAAGSYTVTYDICDALPGGTINCATGTVNLTITGATPPVANPDTATFAYGVGGTVVVIGNDTVAGVPATTINALVTITANGGIAGLSVNGSKDLVVPAATAPGVYVATYQLCDAASPATCTTSTATITISPPAVVAAGDTATVAFSGGTAVVLTNDTFQGAAPASTTDVVVTITNPAGLSGLSVNGAGAIVVPSGSNAPGTFGVVYQICAVVAPATCSSATLSLTISAPVLVAAADAAPVPFSGGSVAVLVNDTISGSPATSANVVVTIQNAAGMTGLTVNGAGAIVVPVGTNAPAAYPVVYQICAVLSPATCTTATATVTVAAPVISATPDPGLSISTAGGLLTVISNDLIDGTPASAANSNVTIIAPGGLTGLTVNASRQIVVPTNAAGTYTITYQICSSVAPASCATTTATVTLTATPLTLVVTPDSVSVPTSGGVANVFSNDTVGGSPASSANATVSLTSTGGLAGLSLSSAGILTIPAATPGNRVASYQLCQLGLPANCASANISIAVSSVVVANPDALSLPASAGGIASVIANDTVDGAQATSSNGVVTLTNTGGLSGLTVNSQMQIVVPAAVAPGNYTITYQLCAVLSPSACAQGTLSLAIAAPQVAALNDTVTIPDTGGTINVIANDTIDGLAASASNSTVSIVSAGSLTGLTVNANRAIVVPAVPSGSYTITYRICSASVSSSCANANVALTVSPTARAIVLADDRITVSPLGGTVNVIANDKMAGAAVVSAQVLLSISDTGGVAGLTIASSGVVTIPAISPGSYVATYKLCQSNVPTNCATARIFVTVSQTTVIGNPRIPPTAPGPAGITTPPKIIGVNPLLFTPPVPTTAGQVGAPLLLGETKVGFGSRSIESITRLVIGGQQIPVFGAEFRYTGSGNITYRWEVVQPGDPEPTPLDLIPAPALSIENQLRQAQFTLIERGEVFLAPFGRYFLKGPDPAKLPRDIDGKYLVLLRIEANSANIGDPISGASPYPVNPMTYFVMRGQEPEIPAEDEPKSDDPATPDEPGSTPRGDENSLLPSNDPAAIEKRNRNKNRFSARTGVAEFSSLGQLPNTGGPAHDGGNLQYRATGSIWPSLKPGTITGAGSVAKADGSVQFQWAEFKDAGNYRLVIDAGTAATSQRMVRPLKSGTTQLELGSSQLPARGMMRWRIEAYSSEAKLIAFSPWIMLSK